MPCFTKRFSLVLLLGTACACRPTARRVRVQQAAAYAPNCSLMRSPTPLYRALTSCAQAQRDFTRQRGLPYAVLYMRLNAGSSTGNTCIRVVQRGAAEFMRYTYHDQQLDSVAVTDASWHPNLLRLASGHFVTVCSSDWTDPVTDILLVKRDTALQFSLSLDRTRLHFSEADEARIGPMREFIDRLNQQGQ
jgi:hypothetical protein